MSTPVPERRAALTRRHHHYPDPRAMLVAGAIALSGCAAPRGPDVLDESRTGITSVEVRVGDFAPRAAGAAGADPAKDAAAGAAVGAAPGLIGMAAVAPACANPITAGVCAVALPVFAVMVVAGGGAGATYGQSAGEMTVSAQRALARAVSDDTAQLSLVARIVDYGTSISNLNLTQSSPRAVHASHEIATLEVALLKADGIEVKGGFWGIVSTHYAVSLEARARLKRTFDGVVLADRTYGYLSAARTPEEWSRDDGKSLFTEVDNGYQQLAEWVIDDFFLTFQVPPKSPASTSPQRGAVSGGDKSSPLPTPVPEEPSVTFCEPIVVPGFGIIFPPLVLVDLLVAAGQAVTTEYCDRTAFPVTAGSLKPVAVDTLRPTLRWRLDVDSLREKLETIRRDTTGTGSPAGPGRLPTADAANLRYQVRIYLAENVPSVHGSRRRDLRTVAPAYLRGGLVDSVHAVEADLAPCSHYLWTVRALFEQDGVTRATEWAGNYWNPFEGSFPPAKRRTASSDEHQMLYWGKPADYAFPISTPCQAKQDQ